MPASNVLNEEKSFSMNIFLKHKEIIINILLIYRLKLHHMHNDNNQYIFFGARSLGEWFFKKMYF